MKDVQLNYRKWVCLLFLTFLFGAGQLWAKVDRTKEFTYSVKCAQDAHVSLKTMDAQVRIESWDKGEVYVKAIIKVEAKSDEKIDEFLSRATFKPNASKDLVHINSPFQIRKTRVKNFGEPTTRLEFENGDKITINQYHIEYIIFMPKSGSLNLKNSYKSVEVTDILGECVFELYSSDLKAGKLGKTSMTLKYGDAEIASTEKSAITLFESSLILNETKSLNLNSRYSRIRIGKADKIDLTSFEDKLKVDALDELKTNIKYGDLKLGNLRFLSIGEAYESNTDISSVDSIKVNNSKYSTYEVDKAIQVLFKNSYEDVVTAKSLKKIHSNCKYTKFKIDDLKEALVIRGYESDVRLYKVDAGFKNIDVSGKYMELEFDMNKEASYDFKAEVKYPDFSFNPKRFEVSKTQKKGETIRLEMQKKGTKNTDQLAKMSIKGYEVDMILREL